MEQSGVVLQVGVKVVIRNKEGKILLLNRAPGKYEEIKVDRWDIVGGRINPGSTLFENLKREVLEETGMELVGEPKLLAAQDILKTTEKHVVRLTYEGEAKGEVKLDEDHSEFGWFDKQGTIDLGEKLDVYVRDLIEKGIVKM